MKRNITMIAVVLCFSILLAEQPMTMFPVMAVEPAQPVLVEPAAPELVMKGECGEHAEFELDSNGTLTVTGTGEASGLRLYSEQEQKNVREKTKRVVISEGISSLGNWMFSEFGSLEAVTLPDSLVSLSWQVFRGCSSLEAIHFPAGLTEIGEKCFDGTPWLKKMQEQNPLVIVNGILLDGTTCTGNVVIPDGVNCIGGYAFAGCEGLIGVSIPDSVKEINEMAFSNCVNLQEVIIPDSVMLLGVEAFGDCSSLSSVKLSKGLTELRPGVFYRCTALTSIEIPDNITSITEDIYVGVDGTFAGCTNLKDITIPSTVNIIDARTFNDTAWLKEKQADDPMVIVNGILVNGTACSGDVVVPETVHRISSDAFCDNQDIHSVVIPDSVKFIGDYAFCLCKNLNSVKLPDGLTSISVNLFQDCESLETVEIPDSVTEIGSAAFENCMCLSTIKLPQNLQAIESYAFSGCISLSGIRIPERLQKIGCNAFENTAWLTIQRKKYGMVIANGILIDGKACYECVVIPDTVTSIADYAFCSPDNQDWYTSRNMFSVRIPKSVQSIGEGAFQRCSNLMNIIILNPDCEIHDEKYTICNKSDYTKDRIFYGTIHGCKNSTAQAYAEKYGCDYVLNGDVNDTGEFDVTDLVALTKYLHGKGSLQSPAAADLNGDGILDVFDLGLMKHDLLQKYRKQVD